MRMHKNKDVEHEALTMNVERNCSIQVDTCQTNGQNHRRCFSGRDKRTIAIIFFSLLSIVSLLLLVLCSVLLQNNNELSDSTHNGVEHQKSNDKISKIELQIITERVENKEILDSNRKLDINLPKGKFHQTISLPTFVII